MFTKLLFALALVSVARADIILPTIAGDPYHPTIAKFDTTLGILSSVTFQIGARVGQRLGFQTNDDYVPGQNTAVSGMLTAHLVAQVVGGPVLQSSKNVNAMTFASPDFTAILDLTAAMPMSATWYSGLDAFQGGGDWRLDFSGGSDNIFVFWPKTGVSMGGGGGQVFTPPGLEVWYSYEPAAVSSAGVHTPEPATWMLVGLALVGMVWRRASSPSSSASPRSRSAPRRRQAAGK